jgi:beta propeller repeat protein
MKNFRNGLGNIVILVFLGGLVIAMIAIFNSLGGQSAGPNSSPAPTAIGVQVSPLSTPMGSSVPLARIGTPVVLRASGRLGQLNLTSDKLVNVAGEDGTMLLDPTSGLSRTLATIGLANARVSDRWLVYEDHPPVTATYYSRIKIIDLNTGREILLGNKNFYQRRPSISENVVVWEDWRNQATSGLDIYGYDLTTGKEFPVVVKPGANSDARISGQWVVYVEPTEQDKYLAELRAHSLKTGEDYAIGIIPAPNNSNNGTYHALDSDKVAWVKNVADGQYELHLSDLTTKTDRQLTGTLHLPPSMLSLSARSGIVVYYDEARRSALDWFQPTPVPLSIMPPIKSQWGYDLSVVGDYLVWRIPFNRESSDGQIIVTKIVR